METFNAIRHKIKNRYVAFKPTFFFINTKNGCQMLVRLTKMDFEVLIHVSEKYESIQVKIDSLIVLNKNRKSDVYCQCGYNLSRFKEYSRCKVCGMEQCCCCHFISFKMNQAQMICYNCNNKSTKKIRSLSTFQKVFNETLTNYVKETDDTEILELVKLL